MAFVVFKDAGCGKGVSGAGLKAGDGARGLLHGADFLHAARADVLAGPGPIDPVAVHVLVGGAPGENHVCSRSGGSGRESQAYECKNDF